MKITESRLRRIIREAILTESNKDKIPIHDAPVTFEFVEEDHGVGMEGFAVSASHPGTDRVGFITAIPYWDELTQRGMSLPKRTMKGHKDVEIYTVDLARLDKIFKGEGLGTQMYKFLVANLSKRNIALVPAEWTRHSDRKSKNSLALHMMDDESKQFPVGERGTSHDALRVWRKFEVPAFYPEWNPEGYKTFQSTRKRGWKDRASKRDDFSIEEALLREVRITPDSLPDGVRFILRVSSTQSLIRLLVICDGLEIGLIEAAKVRGEENPCWGAYEIGLSKSEIDGLGPLMYDIVMEIATELGGGLISDRYAVSTAARSVWQKYQDSRSDVERLQLDSPENEITPTRKDNCDVKVSKIYSGSKELPVWRDHPLSGAYRKPGMPMIRKLVSQGKLEINGFEL